MEGKSFAKLAKDCNLLDKKLTQADVDLIFAKVKVNKAERKIGFQEFIHGINLMAEKKKVPKEELAYFIATSNHGPILKATKVEQVRLHDDKTTYTGVYANGGPTNVDPMPNLANCFTVQLNLEETKEKSPKVPQKAVQISSSQPASTLEEVFFGFTNG